MYRLTSGLAPLSNLRDHRQNGRCHSSRPFCLPDDPFIDLPEALRRQPLAKINHQAGAKGTFVLVPGKTADKGSPESTVLFLHQSSRTLLE